MATQYSADLALKDKGRGTIWLWMRDGIVIGAMGSEPRRYLGLTKSQSRYLARYGKAPK
jgi:hypothetical protein